MSKPINLIPSYRIVARHRTAAIGWWVRGGVVLAVLLAGCLVFFQTRWAADPVVLAASLEAATRRVEDTQKQMSRLEAELQAAQRRVDANRAVTNQPDYAILLALLARTLDDQVVLKSCRFESIRLDPGVATTTRVSDTSGQGAALPPGFEITSTGFAQDQRAVSSYVLRLEQTGLFHEVRLHSTRREPVPFGDGYAIAFEVRCYLATAGPSGEVHHE